MAEGILGLGSSWSTGLSADVIEKLKTAERVAKVEPIETRLEDWDTEVEQFAEIEAKVNELLAASEKFDLFSTDTNSFEQVYATTTGSAASFNATGTSNLKPGTVSVNIIQLAQKDVLMSDIIADKSATMDAGTIDIKIGSENLSFDTTGKTYEAIVTEMNNYPSLDAALEQVSDSEYRLIIKSSESGLANALTITQTGAVDIGFDNIYASANNTFDIAGVPANGEEISFTDGTNSFSLTTSGESYGDIISAINGTGHFSASIVDGKFSVVSNTQQRLSVTSDTMFGLNYDNQTQKAQNMKANVDGIDYNLSTNQIVMQNGLTIAALETGTASVGIQRDTASVESSFQELISQYNDLVDLVSTYTIGGDSKIDDKATLRTMLSSVKDIIFGGDYGTNNDKSIFNYGVDLDKTGHLSLNSETFNTALIDEYEEIRSLMVGKSEDKGIGTKLKEYLDELDGFEGLLTGFGDSMTTKKTNLEDEKTKAIASLDSKYSQLASQFAAYTAIITQFESSFSGLKMMIAESTSS